MKTLIVEKEVLDIRDGSKYTTFAVVCPEPHPLTDRYSLTFEGYLTLWVDRLTAERWQQEIEEVKP